MLSWKINLIIVNIKLCELQISGRFFLLTVTILPGKPAESCCLYIVLFNSLIDGEMDHDTN